MTPEHVLWMAPVWPALGTALLGASQLRKSAPPEQGVLLVSTGALGLSLVSVLLGALLFAARSGQPLQPELGAWFRAGEIGFPLILLGDGLSLPCALLAAILLLATCKFSGNYLHREPGFARFFLLVLAFAAGLQMLLLGGSFDLLFVGWEVVGLTSVLLVAFFWERAGPVRASIRVLITYRLCDVGLLLAALLLHHQHHTSVFRDLASSAHSSAPPVASALLGLGLVLGAMGKSAQFPVGGWLPRAMEGPTASSAIFYGALSVHAGVFLLLRTAPLYAQEPGVRALLVIVGAVTALMASLSGQVSPDAKSALAHATVAQVGLMFVECGLGWTTLALGHLAAHTTLRFYQFLRVPSVLQDALGRRAALRTTGAHETPRLWGLLAPGTRRYLYRLALERFEVEASLERWLVRPALALSGWLDGLERRAMSAPQPPAPPAPAAGRAPSGPEKSS